MLVEESPATAYKVARMLGKAAANVYKAVETLARKGAILVDEGESRSLRAVPPTELLGRVEREFRGARTNAERALARLRSNDDDERVYTLTTREQVIERAVMMLARAEQVVALDLFPEPLEDLRVDIERAAARGVRVRIQAYSENGADIPGADVRIATNSGSMLRAWPQWLNIVADASEHMLALIRSERGDVIQAVWSGSSYLSVIYFSGLDAEMKNAAIATEIRAGASLAQLRKIVANWDHSGAEQLPGLVKLRARVRADS